MTNSIQDVLSTIQQGVIALQNLNVQMGGSLRNISGKLSPSAKILQATRDMTAATGSVPYTGVGFKPTGVVFCGIILSGQTFNIGFDIGTSPRCYIVGMAAGAAFSTGASSIYFTTDFVNVQEAHITSFDTDGFTLSWTKTGAPGAGTGFFNIIAFR